MGNWRREQQVLCYVPPSLVSSKEAKANAKSSRSQEAVMVVVRRVDFLLKESERPCLRM